MKKSGVILFFAVLAVLPLVSADWATCTTPSENIVLPDTMLVDGRFGQSVAMENNVLVVGNKIGLFYIYRLSGSSWVLEQKVSFAASSVALSGNRIVAGNDNSVVVYYYNGASWVLEATLVTIGRKVAIDGDVIVASRGFAKFGEFTDGSASVYRRVSGVWQKQADLIPVGLVGSKSNFGGSIAAAGNLVVIGSTAEAPPGLYSRGAAYVYKYTNGQWIQEKRIATPNFGTAGNIYNGESFGSSVGTDGSVILIGAQGRPYISPQGATTNAAGSVYVFESVGTSWNLKQEFFAADPTYASYFGRELDLSGGNVIVGGISIGPNGGPTSNGKAYIFSYDSTQSKWIQGRKLSYPPYPLGTINAFGYSVAITGNVAAVGSPELMIDNYKSIGGIFTFDCSGTAPLSYSLQVSKTGTGTIKSVTSSGIDCGSYCSESYRPGTSVGLFAWPGDGSIFTGWGGNTNCPGTAGCQISVTYPNKQAIANFNYVALQGQTIFTVPHTGSLWCKSTGGSANSYAQIATDSGSNFEDHGVKFQFTHPAIPTDASIESAIIKMYVLSTGAQDELSDPYYIYSGNSLTCEAVPYNKVSDNGVPSGWDMTSYISSLGSSWITLDVTQSIKKGVTDQFIEIRGNDVNGISGGLRQVSIVSGLFPPSLMVTYSGGSITPFDYTLSAPDVAVVQGSSMGQTVGVTRTAGAGQSVTVTPGTLPSGVTVLPSSGSCNPGTSSCSVSFTYSAGASAATGTSTRTVTGTSSGIPNVADSFSLTVSQSACTFTSASWALTSAVPGQLVGMNVVKSAGCTGQNIRYDIWEDDLWPLPDDFVESVVYSSSSPSWTAQYFDDGWGGPEFYFIATLVSDTSVNRQSSNSLSVSSPGDCTGAEDCPGFGNYCDGVEQCVNGFCVAGTPPVINDGISCTVDSCNEVTDTIVHAPNNALCSNGLYCDGTEICNVASGCQSGTAVSCGAGQVCDEGTDSCVSTSLCGNGILNSGEQCDGTTLGGETCLTRGFTGGTLACTGSCTFDTSGCTSGGEQTIISTTASATTYCYSGGGVNGNPSSSGIFTMTDYGSLNKDYGGTIKFILPQAIPADATINSAILELNQLTVYQDASNPCTKADPLYFYKATALECQTGYNSIADSGAPLGGTASHPSPNTCVNEKKTFEIKDAIVKGVAEQYIEVRGNDLSSASKGYRRFELKSSTTSLPTPKLTITYTTGSTGGCTLNSQCDDGAYCNGAEVCSAGTCAAGTPPVINDGISCTVDSCNEVTDTIVHAPNNALCSNGLYCDGTEICNVASGCQSGTAVSCGAGQVCDEGADSCVNVGGGTTITATRAGSVYCKYGTVDTTSTSGYVATDLVSGRYRDYGIKLKFAHSAIPSGSAIESATLNIYQSGQGTSCQYVDPILSYTGTSLSCEAGPYNSVSDNGVPSGWDASASPIPATPCSSGWKTIDMTGAVLSGKSEQFIELRGQDVNGASDKYRTFYFGSGTNAPTIEIVYLTAGASPPQIYYNELIGAVSRRQHGSAGEFDINLSLNGRTIETRNGGVQKLVLWFLDEVQADDGVVDETEVSLSLGSVDDVSASGNEMMIAISGVGDESWLDVSLNGIDGFDGQFFTVGVLKGDTNGDESTDLIDMAQVKSLNGVLLDDNTAKFDVNTDGQINLIDMALVKSLNGNSLLSLSPPSTGGFWEWVKGRLGFG